MTMDLQTDFSQIKSPWISTFNVHDWDLTNLSVFPVVSNMSVQFHSDPVLAVDACFQGDAVLILPGHYSVTSSLLLPDSITIEGKIGNIIPLTLRFLGSIRFRPITRMTQMSQKRVGMWKKRRRYRLLTRLYKVTLFSTITIKYCCME